MALFGSVAIHAACGLALLVVRSTDSKSVEPTAQAEVAPAAIELVQLVDAIDSGGGGASGASANGSSSGIARSSASRSDDTRRAASRVARVERPTRGMPTTSKSTEKSISDALAELASPSNDVVDGGDRSSHDGAAGDGGDGGGRGGGHGRGVGRGSGLGDRASAGDPLPAVPVAPKASKARPPKLVYPTRERDASEGELYTARVIIDRDGYVVGARIAESHGPKDGDAASMIFKFRYAPALDDDGRPIKATIDQPFLVQ